MSETLSDLLANPVDEERRSVRILPMVLFGTSLPVATSCGIVSRSAQQTVDTVASARRQAREQLEHLTDADVVWLLLYGWAPARWVTQPGDDRQHHAGTDCPCRPIVWPGGAVDHR